MITSKCYRVVLPTLVLSMLLQIWPLPDWLEHLRPEWVTLVLLYWALAIPEQVGVTMAFVVGLLLDVAQGSILGQHALGLVIIVYVVQLEYQRIRVFSLAQQALVILLLLLIKQMLLLWVIGMVSQAPAIGQYFLPSITGAIIWPWLFLLLRDLRRRFATSRRF